MGTNCSTFACAHQYHFTHFCQTNVYRYFWKKMCSSNKKKKKL